MVFFCWSFILFSFSFFLDFSRKILYSFAYCAISLLFLILEILLAIFARSLMSLLFISPFLFFKYSWTFFYTSDCTDMYLSIVWLNWLICLWGKRRYSITTSPLILLSFWKNSEMIFIVFCSKFMRSKFREKSKPVPL